MPNKTIYLPDDLDEISRKLGLNLSQITQQAIRNQASTASDAFIEDQLENLKGKAKKLEIDWPKELLKNSRKEANER